MKKHDSHYGNFDVMNQKEHWDEHTREIVEKRIQKKTPVLIFDEEESELLYEICSILLDDSHPAILQFVVYHFHSKLTSNIGEAQRKKGVPKEAILIRNGLQALQTFCMQQYKKTFKSLEESEKKEIVKKLADGSIPLEIGKVTIPTKDFFKKILSEAVAAFYSYPDVWSEIGYAGPAYPRGYVRTELGLTDPWEAKQHDK